MYQKYVALRDARGVTDYRVAADIGIPRSTFTEWKNGTYCPKLDKLLKIARYFEVPLEELLGEETANEETERSTEVHPQGGD